MQDAVIFFLPQCNQVTNLIRSVTAADYFKTEKQSALNIQLLIFF